VDRQLSVCLLSPIQTAAKCNIFQLKHPNSAFKNKIKLEKEDEVGSFQNKMDEAPYKKQNKNKKNANLCY
jgi:hypothetical protein